LKITVPVGTVDPDPWVTVAVSVTDVVPCGPPELAAVVVVVDSSGVIGGGGGGTVIVTDSPSAPHPLEDMANAEMADAGT
jgi:hypothetical protein